MSILNIKKFFDKTSIHYHNTKSFADDIRGVLYSVGNLIPNHNDSIFSSTMKLGTLGMMCLTSNSSLEPFDGVPMPDDVEIIASLVKLLKLRPDEEICPQDYNGIKSDSLTRYSVPYEGKTIYIYILYQKSFGATGGMKPSQVYRHKDVSKETIIKAMWEMTTKKITLTKSEDGKIEISSLPDQNKKLYGSLCNFIKSLNDDYTLFSSKDIARSYLLIGKPGTGKTTLVNEFVKNMKGSLLKVDLLLSANPSVLSTLKTINPDVIMLDDCDRFKDYDESSILSFIEDIKSVLTKTTLFLVANSFDGILKNDAFIRKGRIDKIFKIPLPDEDDIKTILRSYLQDFKIEMTEDDFNFCVKKLDGLSGADVLALCTELLKSTPQEYFEYEDTMSDIKIEFAPKKSDQNSKDNSEDTSDSIEKLNSMKNNIMNGISAALKK